MKQGFLDNHCTVFPLNNKILLQCIPFCCGDKDLDDFFNNNSDNFNRQLLGNSYCYRLNENLQIIVCAFTMSNSSIDARHLPGSRKKKLTEHIPFEKRLKNYPAALIGRLGVNNDYNGRGIGTELVTYIKQLIAIPTNTCACRYLTVDAYNNPATIRFYEANGFQTLFSTEKQEKEHIGLLNDEELKTRIMFFDLIKYKIG
ncbi:N-acetyltransferase [Bacteroidia bacterium]|nr:N-acetyltransferase [Bacteroidia bacterium]